MKKKEVKKFRIGLDGSCLENEMAGIGSYTFFLLEEWISAFLDVEFFLYANKEPKKAKKKNSSKEEKNLLSFSKYPNVKIRKIFPSNKAHFLWMQLLLPLHLKKDKIDLFWGNTQHIPLWKKRDMKTLFSLHDFTYKICPNSMRFFLRNYFSFFMKKMLKKSDYIAANSHATAKRLEKIYACKANAVIPPPIKSSFLNKILLSTPKKEIVKREKEGDVKPLNSLMESGGIRGEKCQKEEEKILHKLGLKKKKFLLWVGTLEPRKNLLSLLNIYARCLEERKEIYPLIVIGKKGWKCKALYRRIIELEKRYPKKVRYLGYVPDGELYFLYKAARYLLLLSNYEGYGMPLTEASLLGTEIVTRDMEELKEASFYKAHYLSEKEDVAKLPYYFLAEETEREKEIRSIEKRGIDSLDASVLSNRDRAKPLIEMTKKWKAEKENNPIFKI